MKNMRVIDIILPPSQDLPLHPFVRPDDFLSRAIELMVLHNLHQIVVILEDRPIGMVRRKDAFQKIGLRPEDLRGTGEGR